MDWASWFNPSNWTFPQQAPDPQAVAIPTNNPLVQFTNQDINRGIGLATGFAGGGLVTKPYFAPGLAEAPESIAGAAVKYKNQLYSGPNHMAAIENAAKANNIPFKSLADRDAAIEAMQDTEGFLTSTGRHVSRQEAGDIAERAAQFKSQRSEPALWAQDLVKAR